MADAATGSDGRTGLGIRVGWSSVAIVAAGVLAVVVVRNVFVAAHQVLGWAVGAALVAMLLTPVIRWFDRATPRPLAIAVTVLLTAVTGIAVAVLYRVGVSDQVERLVGQAPAIAADIESRDDRVGDIAGDIGLADQVTEVVERFAERVGTGGDAFRSAAGSAPAYFVSTILMIFLLLFGGRMVEGALRLLSDPMRDRFEPALRAAVTTTRRAVGVALVQGVVVGVALGTLAAAMGVPAAPLLGLAAAVAALVPYVGVLLGSLPVVVLGFGVAPLWQAVVVAVVAIGLQTVEGFVVRRRLDRWAMHVGPAIPVIVGALAFAVYGPGAAACAVVIVVLLVALSDELVADDVESLPTPVDDLDRSRRRVGSTG